MTIIDPTNLTAPWHMRRTYERVAKIHRMVYEDCEGEGPQSDREWEIHVGAAAVGDAAANTSAECSARSTSIENLASRLFDSGRSTSAKLQECFATLSRQLGFKEKIECANGLRWKIPRWRLLCLR